MRCQADEKLAKFLDFCTYGHMIDNVVLIVTGTLHERDVQVRGRPGTHAARAVDQEAEQGSAAAQARAGPGGAGARVSATWQRRAAAEGAARGCCGAAAPAPQLQPQRQPHRFAAPRSAAQRGARARKQPTPRPPFQELLDKCHPLGMFDSIATLAVAQNMRELYRLVLVDTPLAPYFSENLTHEDLDEMNIEIMRNTLWVAAAAWEEGGAEGQRGKGGRAEGGAANHGRCCVGW